MSARNAASLAINSSISLVVALTSALANSNVTRVRSAFILASSSIQRQPAASYLRCAMPISTRALWRAVSE